MSLRLILAGRDRHAERLLRRGRSVAGFGAAIAPAGSSRKKAASPRAPRSGLLANPAASVERHAGRRHAGEPRPRLGRRRYRLQDAACRGASHADRARQAILHGASFALAFLIISYVHVVIGEVVPKNLAIEKADRMALLVAPALLVFLRISAPFVFVIERTAAALSRVIGLQRRSSRRRAFGRRTEVHRRIQPRREGHWTASKKTRSRRCWSSRTSTRARS